MPASETATPFRDSCAHEEIISTPSAPASPLYSQAVKAGQHIYVSGLVGIDVSTGKLAGLTIQERTRQALLNCEAILRAACATLETSSRQAYS